MFVFSGGMSKGESARFRASKSKTADNMQREEHRRIVKSFDERLAKVRAKYRTLIDEQKDACHVDYLKVKEEADRLFKEANAKLLEERRMRKNLKKEQCRVERDLLVKQKREEAKILEERKTAENDWWKEIQGIERANKSREKEKPKASAKERRQESDQEVENNIDPHLVPVWHEVKSKIKPNDRKSRTEAFLDWVHEHGDVVAEIQIRQVEKEAEKLHGNRRGAKKTQQQFSSGPLGDSLVGEKKTKKTKKGPKPKNLGAIAREMGDEEETFNHGDSDGFDDEPPF